jgi:rhodanese-related sulfurtransferase
MEQYIEFIQHHTLLAAAWLILAGALVFSFYKSLLSPIKSIGQHQATLLINREDAVVVDIRSQEEFRKGHIAGARHMSPSQIDATLPSGLENKKDAPIIVVCANGITAAGVAAKFHKQGFKRVFNLRGGMSEWLSANLPVTRK